MPLHVYNLWGAVWKIQKINHLLHTVIVMLLMAWNTSCSFFYTLLGSFYPKTVQVKAWMYIRHMWCRYSSYWLMCIDSWRRPVGVLPVAMDLMTVSVKASWCVHPASYASLETAACFVNPLVCFMFSWECLCFLFFFLFLFCCWLTLRLSLWVVCFCGWCHVGTGGGRHMNGPCQSAHVCHRSRNNFKRNSAVKLYEFQLWLHPCMSLPPPPQQKTTTTKKKTPLYCRKVGACPGNVWLA